MLDTPVTHPSAPKEEGPQAQLLDPPETTSIPHQDPLTIQLDGPAIAGLALGSILVVHLVGPLYSEILIVGSAALLLVYHDYRNFLNLGRGGVPSTFWGYLTVSRLRPFTIPDPFSPPRPDPKGIPRNGILAGRNLPHRAGPRPRVAGIIPHRQLDQRGADGPYLSIRDAIQNLASTHPERLTVGRSCFEMHDIGLFARRPVNETCQGEILHHHASDRSMHMDLHPEDIREVLEKGWGQRHPLARRGFHLQETFVMIYAPRDEDELRTVYQIIEAAIWYITAEEISTKAA
ncbi:uncharacterized protein DNG_00564 [Cephalotrichum gorgonifer]|uniref:Luciferase domain-containing protein n=1 Tax=Cephalotrichum gorgonifer TaxID=2041049 RepID=A0AAE8MR16_9PEZI|nr:uncharacterized protein DNG_00564 [Cephalotrichum gorgonifer]